MNDEAVVINRRALMAGALALTALGSLQTRESRAATPPGFLWGVSTAGHQIEGNNINSDTWLLENVKPTIFKERSADACDSYHRYREDIALLSSLGFDSYRFSIEWARIEPDRGHFSIAELDHYKRVIEACHRHGVKPCVTFNHYTTPIWFSTSGSFLQKSGPDLFARFCDTAARHLADGMHFAFTLNEPQVQRVLRWILPEFPGANLMQPAIEAMAGAAARVRGAEHFVNWLNWGADASLEPLIESHKRGRAAIKAVRGDLPVAVTLAIQDFQPAGPGSIVEEVRQYVDGAWLEAVKTDEFVGVQNYSRILIGDKGAVLPPKSAVRTASGMELFPASLGQAVRQVHAATGRPVLVTENGIDTHDDAQRIHYIAAALGGLRQAMESGVPVLGYFHWSLLDNFEWMSGYQATYGLVAVDRTTFQRTPKPSAAYLGAIARGNRI